MQMKQLGSLPKRGQAGFTLIELIVVIVILGILAATALPKFASVSNDARVAKMNAARGAIISASNMYHGKWLAAGSPTTATTFGDGVTVDVNGWLTADAAGYVAAAGGLADYVTALGVVTSDASHTNCKVTYAVGTASTAATVSVAPAESAC